MTDTLTLPHPGIIAARWRFTSPNPDATIASTTASNLRRFSLHPHLEKRPARIAPIFLNGPLSRCRTEIATATDFEALFSAACACIDTEYVERLRFLKDEDARLTEHQDPVSIQSAKTALLLLLNYDSIIRPELVVTQAGHVQLEWHESDYRRLVVECMTTEDARFVILYDLEYVTGLCPASSLVSKLAPYPVWRWFHGGW